MGHTFVEKYLNAVKIFLGKKTKTLFLKKIIWPYKYTGSCATVRLITSNVVEPFVLKFSLKAVNI